MSRSHSTEVPRWIDLVVLPIVNLMFALLVCGIVVVIVGFDPIQVIKLLAQGAFGSKSGWSYTLYYATTFTFTGLAVSVAFHGGLGAALAALAWSDVLPAWAMLPVMIIAAALFGMAWAAVPAGLQAWRGSH